MKDWITSSKRKTHQRAMNQLMSQMNSNILNDSLWRGRFICRQKASQWYQYADGSGAELYVVLELIDRLTGQTKEVAETVNHWRFMGGSHLWMAMNSFIVDTCEVWTQSPRPGTDEYKELTGQMIKKGWNY